MNKKEIFVFDFDETLVDSSVLELKSMADTIRKYAVPNFKDEDVLKHYGPTEIGIIKKLCGKENKEAIDFFLEDYKLLSTELKLKPFKEIKAVLDLLKDNNKTCHILTGRSKETLEYSIDDLNLRGYFKSFYTGSQKGVVKDKLMRKLLEDNNLKEEQVVYFGDTLSDITMMKKVNVDIISLGFYQPEQYIVRLKENNKNTFTDDSSLLSFVKKLI